MEIYNTAKKQSQKWKIFKLSAFHWQSFLYFCSRSETLATLFDIKFSLCYKPLASNPRENDKKNAL